MKKEFFIIHRYLETGFISIVSFSDDVLELEKIIQNSFHYGSSRHEYSIVPNDDLHKHLLDTALLNLCKNCGQSLSFAIYDLFHNYYIKAKNCFDSAKYFCLAGSVILDNY